MLSKIAGLLTTLALILTAGLLTIQILALKFKPINQWVASTTYVEVTPTRTPRREVTPLPTYIPIEIPNPTIAKPVGPVSGTLFSQQIQYLFDDVNQNGTKLQSDKSLWVGTGGFPNSSWLGFRFTGVPIAKSAKIISAKLSVYSTISQKGGLEAIVYGDATAKSLSFSPANLLSGRSLTVSSTSVKEYLNWQEGAWYELADVSNIVSEIVGRTDWASGNPIGFLIKGVDENPNVKFFIGSFDNNPALSAKLTVNYK